MERVCPLCNGLEIAQELCPNCQSYMKDIGSIEDYYDNYSPYLDKEITEKLNETEEIYCIHLFQCPQCNRDKRISILKKVY